MEAAKLSVGRETVDVAPLADSYQIVGELRGGRLYFARRRDSRAEVIVRVVRSAEAGGNNALAHLASDVQLLRTLSHPHMPRVLEGRWLGTDALAVVSERIYGTTVQESLDRGERFTNPRIAGLLEDVYAVISWARAHGVVHRGVTPDSIVVERDTNRLFVALEPTPIPITGVPGEAGDARTIGRLAWTLLSGSAPDATAEESLAESCPNLAARVVDETEKFVRLRDDAEAPDVGHFIGIVAAGDVLKQAEIELTAAKDEYVDWREQEIDKYEAQRIALEREVADTLAALEADRKAFEKFASDERSAIEAERAQMEAAIRDRQDKLAAVRVELDRQRESVDRRLATLESQRAELVELRDEAIALGASARIQRSRMPAAAGAAFWNTEPEIPEDDAATKHSAESGSRGSVMQWLGPVATVVVLVLLIAFGFGMSRHTHRRAGAITVGGAQVIPTPPPLDTVHPPRGGFLTQTPGGEVSKVPEKTGAPLADSTTKSARDSISPDTVATPAPAAATHHVRRVRPDTTTPRDTFPPDTSLSVP